jgi:hypothetical protein
LSKNILDHLLSRDSYQSQLHCRTLLGGVLTLVAKILLSLAGIDSISALVDRSLLVLGDIGDGSIKVGSVLSSFLGEELPVKVSIVDAVSAVLAVCNNGV